MTGPAVWRRVKQGRLDGHRGRKNDEATQSEQRERR